MFDKDKVDRYTLALMYLVSFGSHGIKRAWKGFDWDTMDRLYEKDLISDPKSKSRSVYLTEAGEKLMEDLFESYFCTDQEDDEVKVSK